MGNGHLVSHTPVHTVRYGSVSSVLSELSEPGINPSHPEKLPYYSLCQELQGADDRNSLALASSQRSSSTCFLSLSQPPHHPAMHPPPTSSTHLYPPPHQAHTHRGLTAKLPNDSVREAYRRAVRMHGSRLTAHGSPLVTNDSRDLTLGADFGQVSAIWFWTT